MKYTKVLMAIVALISMITPHAVQSADVSTVMMFTAPFDFYVGEQKLPAGKYMVVRKSESVVHITDNERHNVLFMTIGATNKSKSLNAELLFNRYADDYFLSELRWSESLTSRKLTQSHQEIAIARNYARTQAAISANPVARAR
jgi:hypothetical protein